MALKRAHPGGFESLWDGPKNERLPLLGAFQFKWWAMRDAACGFAARFRCGASLENASRFLSSAPWRVRIPLQGAQKERLPLLTALSIKWWAMRDIRVRLRRPLSLRRFAPCVLRWKTLRVSSAPHPGGFESHVMGPNKNGPLSRTVSKSVVGDEGCRVRLAPPAFASSLRALCAALENAYAFPQLRTLAGSNPMHWAQKRKAPVAGSLSKQVVGDEGFEPPALCV